MDHTSIPTEIWLDIFDFATYLPIMFTESDTPSTMFNMLRKRKFMIRISMRTKRSLVFVCKEWNRLAARNLYSSILIHQRGPRLSLLHRSLIDSRARGKPSGDWTQRLEVSIYDLDLWIRRSGNNPSALLDIIECLPNLNIATFCLEGEANCQSVRGLLPTLGKRCGNSLCILRFHFAASRDEWLQLFAAAPNLRHISSTFKFTASMPWENIPIFPISLPPLPALQSLFLPTLGLDGYFDLKLDMDQLPLLRELGIYITTIGDPHGLRQLLCMKGHNLTKFTIVCPAHMNHAQKVIDLLPKFCPSLTHLELRLARWEHFHSIRLPPVKHLSIRCAQHQASPSAYRNIFTSLYAAKSTNLRSICLLDPEIVTNLCVYHRRLFRRASVELLAQGLILLDCDGRTLSTAENDLK